MFENPAQIGIQNRFGIEKPNKKCLGGGGETPTKRSYYKLEQVSLESIKKSVYIEKSVFEINFLTYVNHFYDHPIFDMFGYAHRVCVCCSELSI